ncbi:MAG: protein-glutamate O-methyltransferase CheR [Marinilabilia sp.]
MTYKEYLQVLKNHSPYDFSEYSDNSIFRRIQKVMRDHHLTLDELGARTRSDHLFVEQVVEAITVNTTELFRDPSLWRFLLDQFLPAYRNNNFINIWSAGCSTGEEVYSLAILLNELGMLEKSRIFATDISQKAIDAAKKGMYKHQLERGCIESFKEVFRNRPGGSPDFSKYFDVDEDNDRIKVRPFLKKNVKFQKHDLVKNEMPFYNKLDIIFCRNVLIYFNVKLQNRIVQRFFDHLYAHGALILGAHEGLNGFFKTKFNRSGPVYTKSNVFHFKY